VKTIHFDLLLDLEPNFRLTLRVIEGSPEKITCAVDIMEFAIGSTALEARSTSCSVNWKLLPASTCGLYPVATPYSFLFQSSIWIKPIDNH
jgi:hypothetical protein